MSRITCACGSGARSGTARHVAESVEPELEGWNSHARQNATLDDAAHQPRPIFSANRTAVPPTIVPRMPRRHQKYAVPTRDGVDARVSPSREQRSVGHRNLGRNDSHERRNQRVAQQVHRSRRSERPIRSAIHVRALMS